jgi:hypothetical protein
MRGLGMGTGLGLAGMVLLTGCWQVPSSVAHEAPATVQVLPAAATLTAGKTLTFAARIDDQPAADVAWSVLEAGGGRVDGAGAYHAPVQPGVYTVRAQVKDGPAAAAKVTVVAPPAGEIIAPPRVLPQAPQVARIAPVSGSQYHWGITGGLITAGTDTASISFQAGAGPKVMLACQVTNAAGDVLNSSLEVPVASPVSLAIKPAAVTLTAERTMKFGFDLAGGTSLNVVWSLGEPGAGSLDGSGNYVAPAVPGDYTVRVSSVDDPAVNATAAVKVVAKPPQSLFAPDSFLPGAEGLRARVPEVDGMSYAWEIEGGTITAGASAPSMVFDAGPGPELTLHCRITNAAGDSFAAVKVLKAL